MLRANFLSHDPASQACYSMQPFQVAHQDTLEGDLPRRIRTLPTSIQVRMRSGFPGHQYCNRYCNRYSPTTRSKAALPELHDGE